MLTKTDFLGNEYGAGDFVIYGQASGRCINMVKGQVVEVKENGKVLIQPLAGSRWSSHSQHSYYVDNRTEKKINPNLDTGKHYKDARCYKHRVTGEKITYADLRALVSDSYKVYGDWEFVNGELEDYVELRKDPIKPVTISVTENIVKFADGNLPTEV